jgi:hypothetical protein
VVAAGRLPPNAPAPAVHRNGTLFATDDGAIVTADEVLCAGHYPDGPHSITISVCDHLKAH